LDDPKKCKPCLLLGKDNHAVRWVMSNGVAMGLCENHAAPYRFSSNVDLTTDQPPDGSAPEMQSATDGQGAKQASLTVIEPSADSRKAQIMPQTKNVRTEDIASDYKERGLGVLQIAQRRGVSTSTVAYHMKKAGIRLDYSRRKQRKDARKPKPRKDSRFGKKATDCSISKSPKLASTSGGTRCARPTKAGFSSAVFN